MTVSMDVQRDQKTGLLEDRDMLRRLLLHLRDAATSRSDYEPHDTVDDEAAIQAEAIEGRLAAIDRALHRIDTDSYGSCIRCARPIRDERLAALPACDCCLDCAEEGVFKPGPMSTPVA